LACPPQNAQSLKKLENKDNRKTLQKEENPETPKPPWPSRAKKGRGNMAQGKPEKGNIFAKWGLNGRFSNLKRKKERPLPPLPEKRRGRKGVSQRKSREN